MQRIKRIDISRLEIDRLTSSEVSVEEVPFAPNSGSGKGRSGKWDRIIDETLTQLKDPLPGKERSENARVWGPFKNRDEAKACANAIAGRATTMLKQRQINWKIAYVTSETAGRWYCYVYKIEA